MGIILPIIVSALVSLLTSFGMYSHQVAPTIESLTSLKTSIDLTNKTLENSIDTMWREMGTKLGSDQVSLVAGSSYVLSGSGVSSSATSIGLTSFTIPQNGYKIQDSDLSSIFYITLEPGSPTRQEIVSCTTDTQNAGGTATFSGCTRGLSPVTPFTASSSLQFAHAGGTKLIFSNPPQLYNQAAFKDNDESIGGVWDFNQPPRYLNVPAEHLAGTFASSTAEFASVALLQATSFSGTTNATNVSKGIVQLPNRNQIASSTSLGSTGASLALNTTLATTTCSVADDGKATTSLVATRHNGTINPNCIDTTGFTFTGTTTMDSLLANRQVMTGRLIATSSVISLRSIDYTLPIAQATASNTVLANNGSGSLIWAGEAWQLLGETTLTGTAGTTTVSGLPARTLILVDIFIPSQTGDAVYLAFNTDYAANYGYGATSTINTTQDKNTTSKIRLNLTSSNVPEYHTARIPNISGTRHFFSWNGVKANASGTVLPERIEGDAAWSSTSQITTVEIVTGSLVSTFGAGTRVSVYGSRE